MAEVKKYNTGLTEARLAEAFANALTKHPDMLAEINDKIGQNASDIEANTASITTNTKNIAINTASIAENTANISANTVTIAENDAIAKTTLGYTAKNLLKNTATTTTTNGITFTVNDDGSVTVNGTATANATITINSAVPTDIGKTYIWSLSDTIVDGVYMSAFDSNWVGLGKVYTSLTHTETVDSRVVRLTVLSGTTVDNVTFYPMLRYADITDSTYVPYQPSVRATLDDILARLTALETATTTTTEV